MLKAKLLGATAAAESLAIEDVFSTYLYTGNGSTQTITNGIDLAGEGGLVWIKARSTSGANHLGDTARGGNKWIYSNLAQGEDTVPYITSFNADGFSLNSSAAVNANGSTYASWTFRKAERFFDIVTWVGNGASSRQIPHNLGVVPGAIFVKVTGNNQDWSVYHRSMSTSFYQNQPQNLELILNSESGAEYDLTAWGGTQPTATHFTVGTQNNNGYPLTYIAYIFAHDPLGPSEDGSDGLIACGSYTGNGNTSGTNEINLGWEPQFILIKNSQTAGTGWVMFDTMRGIPTSAASVFNRTMLKPNTADAEASVDYLNVTSTGFRFTSANSQVNATNDRYVYIAIRRGPMREPTSGTEVFSPVAKSVDNTFTSTGHVVDLLIESKRTSPNTTYQHLTLDRLRGINALTTFSTAAEAGVVSPWFSSNTGFNPTNFYAPTTGDYMFWAFRRAPGFFDVVAYTGTGSARTVPHNLGVAPELIIFKARNTANDNWFVYAAPLGPTKGLYLNATNSAITSPGVVNDTAPTESVFSTSAAAFTNINTTTYIAYLFATLPGISKVGSYTGNGSNQTINCGFTTGARFVLIKRTDSTGDWYVWDTARGIVTGNDPHLSLNTTAAEVTTDDSVDPDSTGFIVNQVAATNVNVNAATYIYLAIA